MVYYAMECNGCNERQITLGSPDWVMMGAGPGRAGHVQADSRHSHAGRGAQAQELCRFLEPNPGDRALQGGAQ